VAYLEDRKLVTEILKLEGSRLRIDDAVMATYFSPGGKPYAWQVKFDMDDWTRISKALGLESRETEPARFTGKRKTKPAAARGPKAAKTRAGSRRARMKHT
jgi:hypothetical protein